RIGLRASVSRDHSILCHKRRRPVKTLERSGVGPPSVDPTIAQLAPFDELIVHVRDFELTARGRLQPPNNVEDTAVVNINARNRDRALRFVGLLLDSDDLVVLENRDAKPARIRNFREENATASARVSGYRVPNPTLEDIVAENDTDRLTVREVFGE